MEKACEVREDTFYNEYTDEWQRMWAAREVGLMVSRQNGKGSILEARELAGLFLLGERTVVHSAHQFDTSKEHFLRMLSLIEGVPDFDNEIDKVTRSHGDEGILLKKKPGSNLPPQRLRFRTRTKGGGRGWSPDFIALDESMYLTSEQIGALMPSASARPNYQIWYTGSAGTKESTQFGRVRHRAMKGVKDANGLYIPDPKLMYAEWSIDGCTNLCLPYCDEHDRQDTIESFAKANPGLGIRITVETIEIERRSMSEEMFAQERLGIGDWPVEGDQWAVIGEDSWRARIDEASEIKTDSIKVLGVDTSPNREFSCLAVCGENDQGLRHVEITSDEVRVDHRPDAKWLVPRIKEIWDRAKLDAVVIDRRCPAGAFIDELESLGVTVIVPSTSEVGDGCGSFTSGVQPRKGEVADIVHIDQRDLGAAVAGADKRPVGDKWGWDKKSSATDITPLVAATLAAWGYRKVLFEKPKAATPWVFYGDDE
ncbi:terminase [Streptomyces sp. NPDC058471]|uniref:terminase n=1 Tax=Streptomyces sp. NPDC058471 TaxID=3346516 RepID=UPI00365B5109